MKFRFPFKSTEITITNSAAAASSWPWPSCATSPRTLSFRATTADDDNIYKTITPAAGIATATRHDESFSPSPELEIPNPESAVISGVRSERLFFEPGAKCSILEEAKADDDDDRERVAMVVMDSRNPFVDFRVSMGEMVEACGGCGAARDWEFLEELLEWYLRVNDESNRGYIVGAFVDLLLSAIDGSSSSSSASSSSAATKYSFTTPLSFSSSSTEDEIVVHKTTV